MATAPAPGSAPQSLQDLLKDCGQQSGVGDLKSIIELIIAQSGIQIPTQIPPSMLQVLKCLVGKVIP